MPDVCAISVPASVNYARNHGVYKIATDVSFSKNTVHHITYHWDHPFCGSTRRSITNTGIYKTPIQWTVDPRPTDQLYQTCQREN